MKKITILIVMAVLCLFFKVSAQNYNATKTLKVGDTIPDLVLDNVLNYKFRTIRLSDYKDKLVIIDFWATSCAPCIAHMPIIYNIQKRFPDQVFILPVVSKICRDKPEGILSFFAKRKAEFNLPTVALDTILTNYLKPLTLGTYYWIKNGIIVSITDEAEINETAVAKMVSGFTKLRQKNNIPFDVTKPVFIAGNGGEAKPYIFRSILFPWVERVMGGKYEVDDSNKVVRIAYFNDSPLQMLLFAYPEYGKFCPANVKIRVKNKDALTAQNFTPSNPIGRYCYVAIFPPVTKEKAQKYFREDLARYFSFQLDSARLKDTCLVLHLNPKSKFKHGTEKRLTNAYEHPTKPIFFYGMNMLDLKMFMENEYEIPVIDETGYQENIWLDLPAHIKNFPALQKSLASQGFTLTKEIREQEYLVVTDSDPTP